MLVYMHIFPIFTVKLWLLLFKTFNLLKSFLKDFSNYYLSFNINLHVAFSGCDALFLLYLFNIGHLSVRLVVPRLPPLVLHQIPRVQIKKGASLDLFEHPYWVTQAWRFVYRRHTDSLESQWFMSTSLSFSMWASASESNYTCSRVSCHLAIWCSCHL